jgi:hypothetical protein
MPQRKHKPEEIVAKLRQVAVVCPHLVARFKPNASWAWRLWLKAVQPATARRWARAACSRGSSVGAVYCSAGASSR